MLQAEAIASKVTGFGPFLPEVCTVQMPIAPQHSPINATAILACLPPVREM
jgi:hypothetical protein